LGIAREIFGAEIYDCPLPVEPTTVKTIVDLGANVGYALLYFLNKYPNATIHAFEPHPVSFAIATRHLELNKVSPDRVRLLPLAAGRAAAQMYLSDEGAGSRVIECPAQNSAKIDLIDIFAYIESLGQLDILKIDIEGGEYALMEDERFLSLSARIIALEFHKADRHTSPKNYCIERLNAAGYAVRDVSNTESGNMLWGVRLEPTETVPASCGVNSSAEHSSD
jgi:FkbM family methyltransferase